MFCAGSAPAAISGRYGASLKDASTSSAPRPGCAGGLYEYALWSAPLMPSSAAFSAVGQIMLRRAFRYRALWA
jgi:hypothetical protein